MTMNHSFQKNIEVHDQSEGGGGFQRNFSKFHSSETEAKVELIN